MQFYPRSIDSDSSKRTQDSQLYPFLCADGKVRIPNSSKVMDLEVLENTNVLVCDLRWGKRNHTIQLCNGLRFSCHRIGGVVNISRECGFTHVCCHTYLRCLYYIHSLILRWGESTGKLLTHYGSMVFGSSYRSKEESDLQ